MMRGHMMTATKFETKFEHAEIEKGIPVPGSLGGVTALLRRMQLGDSVAFHTRTTHQMLSLCHPLKREGLNFTARKLPDGGCRVWRIA